MLAYACAISYYLIGDLATSEASQVSCISQLSCQQQLGPASQCIFDDSGSQGTCVCDDFFTQTSNNTCVQCPGIGESCQQAHCCNEDCLVCYSDVCTYIYNDICLGVSDTERQRFQRVAQCILAVALVLTASILVILFWKACAKRNMLRRRIRHMSIDSYVSLNSIQRLVLLQLQDRPPPYSREYNHPRKLVNEITDPPPSYIEAVGGLTQPEGEENPIFILGEHPLTSTSTEDTVSSNISNSSPSDISSSLPQQSTAHSSATTSNGLLASQTHITLTSPSASLHDAEEHCSQNGLERCYDSNLVLTQNTELYM